MIIPIISTSSDGINTAQCIEILGDISVWDYNSYKRLTFSMRNESYIISKTVWNPECLFLDFPSMFNHTEYFLKIEEVETI